MTTIRVKHLDCPAYSATLWSVPRPLPPDIDPEAFGTRLNHARIAAGYKTQKEFADALGAYLPTVNKWLKGKALPELETALRACALVGVSAEEVFYGTRSVHNGGEPAVQSEALKRVFASEAGQQLSTQQRYSLAQFLDGLDVDEWRVRAVVELVLEGDKKKSGGK